MTNPTYCLAICFNHHRQIESDLSNHDVWNVQDRAADPLVLDLDVFVNTDLLRNHLLADLLYTITVTKQLDSHVSMYATARRK